jgi:predicted metal-dependent phosphoesterase TrpH
MEVIAVSDHDTFAAVPRAAEAARALGVTLVPAMEVTSLIHFGTASAEQVLVLASFPPGFAL